MRSIGIIANPASGKDIRRIVAYATTVDNQGKLNIVKRVVLGAQGLGVDHIYFMPDTFNMGLQVQDDLSQDNKLTADCQILDYHITASSDDTTRAAFYMQKMGVGCAVVLGGDGTSRAAAKAIGDIPVICISTGTNNVYPVMMEGTIAGMAAAMITRAALPLDFCIHDKRIEIAVNGKHKDIALIDAVISKNSCIGSRAIWETEQIQDIIVTRAHPASTGFSAVVGCMDIIRDVDDFGMMIHLGSRRGSTIFAPIAAGMIESLKILRKRQLALDETMTMTIKENSMLALDGERELRLNKGDQLSVTITRNGPWRVNVPEILEYAVSVGNFKK